MKPNNVITIRHILKCVIMVSLMAAVGLLVVAIADGSLGSLRRQVLLTFVGLIVGSLLAIIFIEVIHHSPGRSLAGLVAIAASQTAFLLWVWTRLATNPLLYRLWWFTMVPAVTFAFTSVLRAATANRNGRIERGTRISVFSLGVALTAIALYKHLPPDPFLIHQWLIALLATLSLVGSLHTWYSWAKSRRQSVATHHRAIKPWLCVSHIALLIVGLYIGRATAPPSGTFEGLPSALAGLSNEEIDTQVRADLELLKTLTTRIDDLAESLVVIDAEVRKSLAADGRNYYLPEEEDQIRWQFMSYLSLRTALIRLAITYAGFEAVHDPDIKARCFTVGHASAMTAFQTSLKFVNLYQDEPMARGKLNEAEPHWGVPAGMFDRIYESVTNESNVELTAEMAAYFAMRRDRWRDKGVWPAHDFEWLETRIERGQQYVSEHRINASRAWIDRFVDRVKKDAYTPAYTAQSIVAAWIGDTRIVEKQPLIDVSQIEEIASLLRPGDIILERRNWCLSNAFLPGFWPHAALYVGNMNDLKRLGIADDEAVVNRLDEYLQPAADGHEYTVVEAVSEGVIFNSLTESMHADYVAVLRPRVSEGQIAQAIVRAFRHKGKPYDFEFDFSTSDKLVCTELVYRAYDGILHFDLVQIVGRPTLPALEIVRKFADERLQPDRELDFVLFLDADHTANRARQASAETLCESVDRPRAFNE